jgi:FkbM family methyltransferase
VWLDLGANIGAFALWALDRGVDSVVCYEPEPTNYAMLEMNVADESSNKVAVKTVLVKEGVDVTAGEKNLYMPNDESRPYRASMLPRQNNGRLVHAVKAKTLANILKCHPTVTSIKMDIEGTEIALLEQDHDWSGITHLVVEYSFDKDPSLARFYAIVRKLAQHFNVQYDTKVDKCKDRVNFTHFPKQAMLWCLSKDVSQTEKQAAKNKGGFCKSPPETPAKHGCCAPTVSGEEEGGDQVDADVEGGDQVDADVEGGDQVDADVEGGDQVDADEDAVAHVPGNGVDPPLEPKREQDGAAVEVPVVPVGNGAKVKCTGVTVRGTPCKLWGKPEHGGRCRYHAL